ncbi:MAG: aminoglycoside phosphotransferase, partial [Candidatus Thermoplasmatota archaeon]
MELKLEKELLSPEIYPEHTNKVELVQTHISWVFITDNFVYKVKKPVNFGFLDFSTLAKRKYYCEQEVLLNRRLAPEIYLGTVPITQERNRRLVFGGSGEIIDYAVKMKKLLTHRLMSNLLKEGKLTSHMIKQVAEKIADFHVKAETNPEIAKFGTLETIKTNTDENFEQTKKYMGTTITEEQYKLIKNYTDNFYKFKSELIKKRIAEGRIKDCHGDMHMQHVCITDKI